MSELAFEFAPVISGGQDAISSTSPGHIIVAGGDGECSSPQVMLIISVCDFLSGLIDFLTGYADKQYVFVTVAGDYGLKLVKKTRSPLLSLYCTNGDRLIARATQEELTEAVWAATQRIHAGYTADFPGVASGDDTISLELDVREWWETLLNRWLAAFPGTSTQAKWNGDP